MGMLLQDEEILVREREVEKKSWSEVAHVFGGKRTDNHVRSLPALVLAALY